MNCEKFQTVLSELAREEILRSRPGALVEAAQRRSALTHVEECEACAQVWKAERELSKGLGQLAEQQRSVQAPMQLEAKLRAAFRDQARVKAPEPAAPAWRYWALAVAALLLMVFGLVAWRARSGTQATPSFVTQRDTPRAKPVESPQKESTADLTTGDKQDGNATGRHEERNRNPARFVHSQRVGYPAPLRRAPATEPLTGAANPESAEVVTDFVALGYGSALDLQDGGQLVRVELPRSALARFGLPMNMNRADERIKADVLVGTDGLAHAIRFVK